MEQSVHSPRLVRFESFEVDLPAGELHKGGVKLKLTGQPFQVLAILLERPGEVVTREELQKRLWPDTFVDVDHNLNTAINKIREVLGDSADSPRFVETLPRRGYRFVAPVEGAQTTDLDGGSGVQQKSRAPWARRTSILFVVLVVLAAAAFEMNFGHFLLAIFAGRFVRFLIEALLTLWFGPQIVTMTGNLFAHHVVWILAGIGVLGAGWLIWRRAKRPAPSS